jgi:hypothetical protein
MAKLKVAIGAKFLLRSVGSVWRVEQLLRDGVHISLVNVNDQTLRKTLSVFALSDSGRFVPQPC